MGDGRRGIILACFLVLTACEPSPSTTASQTLSPASSPAESRNHLESEGTHVPQPQTLAPPPASQPSSTGLKPLQSVVMPDGSRELVIPMSEFGGESSFEHGVVHTMLDVEKDRRTTITLETACPKARYTGTALRIPLGTDATAGLACWSLQTGAGITGAGERIDQSGTAVDAILFDLNRKIVTDFEEVHRKAAASMVEEIRQEIEPQARLVPEEITLALTEDLMEEIRNDQLNEVPPPLRDQLEGAPPRQAPLVAQVVARVMTDPAMPPHERRTKIREALGLVD